MPGPTAPDPARPPGAARVAGPINPAEQRTLPGAAGPPPSAADLPYGAIIGRYLVLKRIGQGGMGVVYAAYDPDLNRKVAIKLIRERGSIPGHIARLRLLREAQAMAQLTHPNVIAVFDVGTAFDQIFVAMEFIDGWTLRQWLKAEPRSQLAIVSAFELAGRGLAAAHAAGFIHRDFKPDNVLVSKDGRVLVTDFGLARIVDVKASADAPNTAPNTATRTATKAAINNPTELAAETVPDPVPEPALADRDTPLNTALTDAGLAVGTLAYMAPEQLMAQDVDPRADQFGFCVALYEACYKVEPFEGATSRLRLDKMYNRGPQLPETAERLPPRWHRALLRGLCTEPDQRFPTMGALLAELGPDQGPKRRRWLLISMMIILVIALAGLYVRAQKRSLDSYCRHATNRQPALWDAGTKKAVHKALLATDRSEGESIWKRLAPELDDYVQKWKAMNTESCQATLIRREQSAVLYELRQACLDRRRHEFSAFTTLLLTADKSAVQRAESALDDFTPVSACADIAALSAPTPMPDQPQLRERIRSVYRSLEELKAFEHIGKYSIVTERARALVGDAQALGYAPALAEAEYLLAKVLFNTNDYGGAEQAYIAAAAAAVQGHDAHLAARAYTALVGLSGIRRQFAAADTWEALAQAELGPVPNNPSIRVRLLLYSCQNSTARRQFAAATQSCQAALKLCESLDFQQTTQHAAVLRGLANLQLQQDHLSAALPLFAQVIQSEERLYGPLHPTLAATLRELALVLFAQENPKEAQTQALRALAIDEHSFGPLHVGLADSLRLLANLALVRGDPAEAIEYARRALLGTSATLGPDHIDTAMAHCALGDVYARSAHFAAALAEHRAAVAGLAVYSDEVRTAAATLGIAEDLLAIGQAAEALPMLQWGFPAQLPAWELALRGRRDLAWARALWAVDREGQARHAHELALAARKSYEQLGSQARRELAEVNAWIAAVPSK